MEARLHSRFNQLEYNLKVSTQDIIDKVTAVEGVIGSGIVTINLVADELKAAIAEAQNNNPSADLQAISDKVDELSASALPLAEAIAARNPATAAAAGLAKEGVQTLVQDASSPAPATTPAQTPAAQ